MPRFYFEKLVRDKVLERCLEDPKVKTTYHTLGNADFIKELIQKIHEEANEIPVQEEVSDEVREELADLQSVVDALAKAWGLTPEDIKAEQGRKGEKDGGFDGKVYISHVDLEEDSEWVARFRAKPEKFREEK